MINKMPNQGKTEYRAHKNILIEKYKTIYFFIPKNGSTSFKASILPFVVDSDYRGAIHKYNYPFAKKNLLQSTYKDYLKFAFVRNPWSRVASCFKGKIRSSKFNSNKFKNGVATIFLKYGDLFYGDMPFEKFVDAICAIPHAQANPHFMSQLYRLTDNSGRLLPNYLGRLENIQPSIEAIYKMSGLFLSGISHMNKSRVNISYTELYTQESKDKIKQKFAADVEAFGYEFETDEKVSSIGFVDEAFRERLARSQYIHGIIEEKKL